RDRKARREEFLGFLSVLYSIFYLYVVSAFRRTTHGPAKAGHYVLVENALKARAPARRFVASNRDELPFDRRRRFAAHQVREVLFHVGAHVRPAAVEVGEAVLLRQRPRRVDAAGLAL